MWSWSLFNQGDWFSNLNVKVEFWIIYRVETSGSSQLGSENEGSPREGLLSSGSKSLVERSV